MFAFLVRVMAGCSSLSAKGKPLTVHGAQYLLNKNSVTA